MEFKRVKLRIQRIFQFGEYGPDQTSGSTVQRTALLSRGTLGLAIAGGLVFSTQASASFASPYGLSDFTLTNTSTCAPALPNGTATSLDGGLTLLFTGSDSGSGCDTTTTFLATAAASGTVSFDYIYRLDDPDPGFDLAGYSLADTFHQFASLHGEAGTISFAVTLGQTFGFQINTDDQGGPGSLTISNFSAPTDSGGAGVPEPSSLGLAAAGLATLAAWHARKRRHLPKLPSRNIVQGVMALALLALPGYSQTQFYVSSTVTGIMTRTAVVNLTTLAGVGQAQALRTFSVQSTTQSSTAAKASEFAPASVRAADYLMSHAPQTAGLSLRSFSLVAGALNASLPITSTSATVGFDGLTHKDQRESNNGNQFSIEPPNQSIAVANGYVLEGVNSAIRIFSANGGAPLLPTLAANQVFNVLPPINRTTDFRGVNGTDMRVYFDHTSSRWFILQRAQDNTGTGALLLTSKIYLAVSQTSDPTQNYNIYTINTTHNLIQGVNGSSIDDYSAACPCVADYPQIGSDQYGFYIGANEYVSASNGLTLAGNTVLAISKAGLVANAVTPTVARFSIANASTYEFSLQPATTAPGSSHFVASGGVEYMVSTTTQSSGSNVALWAVTNTASLGTNSPYLVMAQILVPTQTYSKLDSAVFQKNGPLALGSNTNEYFPPFTVARNIDGGDSRVQSVTYSGGKLFVSWASGVTDENGALLSGGAYLVMTPTYRSGTLSARVNNQGLIQVLNNSLLRPYWAVNASGKGALVFTLVGRDRTAAPAAPGYFPSVAYITADATSIGNSVQTVAPGTAPEDGFTGYDDSIARWGDYNGAVATADGSIWMVGQYIPNLPRSLYANWGTYIFKLVP